jgi:hypothetical protein
MSPKMGSSEAHEAAMVPSDPDYGPSPRHSWCRDCSSFANSGGAAGSCGLPAYNHFNETG